MKKLGKILSLVLAISLVASLFAVNVSAAQNVHILTASVASDKTTGLATGDEVIVEVKLDDSFGLYVLKYDLVYDTDVFSIKTGTHPALGPNFAASGWWSSYNAGNLAAYLGKPQVNAVDGAIKFSAAGSYAIDDYGKETDALIGKYVFTVKDGVANGTVADFVLTGQTSENPQEGNVDATGNTVSVTVGTPAPEKEDVVIATPAVQKSEEANGVYNAGFLADFTVDADANNAVKAVKFTVNNGSDNAETTVELGTTVEAGTVKVALNILNVTAGVELTTTVAPIAE